MADFKLLALRSWVGPVQRDEAVWTKNYRNLPKQLCDRKIPKTHRGHTADGTSCFKGLRISMAAISTAMAGIECL